MALNATVQKNPADEKEEDPIRTMQKDIAMLQRGEYKPRRFVAPKPILQSPPTNIWETKEDEQNPLQRLEQSEFKSTEGNLEKNPDEPPTLAEIGVQLAKKQSSQQPGLPAQEPPKQEPVIPAEEPIRSLPSFELKNIPEIDILGLENFTAYAPAEQEKSASSNLSPLSDTGNDFGYPAEEIIPPQPPAIEEVNIMGKEINLQNPKSKTTNKEDEHDILGLDQKTTNPVSYPSELFGAAATKEDLPYAEETKPKKRLKLPSVSRKFLLVGIIIFVGVTAIAGGYMLFKSAPVAVPPPPPAPAPIQPPPPTAPEPPPTPQSAIPTSSDLTLSAENINDLRSQLITSLSDLSQPNTLNRILMKLENANEVRYLNFAEILSVLNLLLPEELKNNFDFSNATLFTYGQPEGTRLGFAVAIADKNSALQSATNWESTAYEDAQIMLSYSGITQTPAEMLFLDNNRGDVNIRYLNLLSPNLTIDYAVTDTLFIFTTSRDSMFAALEAVGK